MHVIPDVDDGSRSLEESLEMLRMAAGQGVDAVVATPHSSAFERPGPEEVRRRFDILEKEARRAGIGVRLYFGAEIAGYDMHWENCLRKLEDGTYPGLAGTDCVLTEFDTYGSSTEEEVLEYVRALTGRGYLPVLAHVERYTLLSIEGVRTAKELGARVQVNAYSLDLEPKETTKKRARTLLENGLVDLLGSDAHKLGHRAPRVAEGIRYIREHCDPDYAEAVLQGNARALLDRGCRNRELPEGGK